MAYYDVYDSNDNLIASDVWIDDEPSGGEPISINVYRVFLFIVLIIGVISTFITPIILFINRDAFIENGWIYMAIMNLVIGVPALAGSLSLLKIKKDENYKEDPYYNLAEDWVNKNVKDDVNNENLELGIINLEATSKKELAIDALYLKIKFQKGFDILSNISYLIYPMAIISILMEVFMGELDSFFIVLLNSNFMINLFTFFNLNTIF